MDRLLKKIGWYVGLMILCNPLVSGIILIITVAEIDTEIRSYLTRCTRYVMCINETPSENES